MIDDGDGDDCDGKDGDDNNINSSQDDDVPFDLPFDNTLPFP
jgi:hypothetical protein